MQLRFIDEHNDRGHLLWAEEPVGLALRGETQQAALSKLPAELFDTICVSAGKIGAQVEVAPADLIALLGAQTADVTAE